MSSPSVVHLGLDGWVFLVGGSNNVLDHYTNPGGMDGGVISDWVNLIYTRAQRIGEQGIQYLHLFAPEKLSVYPEFFGEHLSHFNCHPISSFMSEAERDDRRELIEKVVVNPIPYFKKQKDYYQLYWKTDSHWRFEGCFSAYQLICSRMGIKPLSDLHTRPFGEGMVTFDLGGKFDPVIKEKGRFYKLLKNASRIRANELVVYKEDQNLENEGGLHIGSEVVFRNLSTSVFNAKVVVFGDSFSEYRPTLLTGMLAETFRDVHFVWSTNIDFEYVQRVSPDIVITECAERFMSRVPNDDFDLDTYSRARLAEFRNLQLTK